MTRDAAEKVIHELLGASRALNEALRVMQAEAPDSVFTTYRKSTAEVMAAIYLDLMKPIVAFHPDLNPTREDDGDRPAES